jgi:glyoxylase-like metal-dependent hydrolase (beta-lactamase superfamily II)
MGKGEPDVFYEVRSLLKGYKAVHLSGLSRILEVDFDAAPEVAPFGHVVDLLGDGSVWLVDARGHTPGHFAVLVNLEGGPALLVGDTVQTPYALEHAIPSGNVTDKERAASAAQRMLALHQQFPQLRFFYGHDPSGVRLAPASYP